PVLRDLLAVAAAGAAARSATSERVEGAFARSSSHGFSGVPRHRGLPFLPTGVEPVKLILRTSGWEVSSVPIAPLPEPVTMLRTPAGIPARTPSSARASAERGVWIAGLQTIVQPAARAGPTLRVIMAAGKFHGVMAATTPTGWRMTSNRLSD